MTTSFSTQQMSADVPQASAEPERARNRTFTFACTALGLSMVVGAGLLAADHVSPTGIGPAEPAIDPLVLQTAAFRAHVPATRIVRTKVERGDTLVGLLTRAGMASHEAGRAVAALGSVFDARLIRPGQEISVYFQPQAFADSLAENAVRLTGLSLRSRADATVTVSREQDGDFQARELVMQLTSQPRHVKGTIDTSLAEAAIAGGATMKEVVSFADAFAYDLDFQRDIREGDTFEMVFDSKVDERGKQITTGDLMFVRLNAQQDKQFYRYTSLDGETDFFDENGRSARKFLMKTPINGARLSSGFGYRRHPILGYNKLHKGTDFAAPTGTPIMAAGSGRVVKAGWAGGYGRYVRLEHANGWDTAYAHMSGFGEGIRVGMSVRQGQIIGYVGSSGRSTGPHLHYEVLKGGVQVNPTNIKVPTGRNLEGRELARFAEQKAQIDAIRNAAPAEPLVAAP